MGAWFLLCEKEPLGAAGNMARDEYLFELCHQQKIGFLRIYGWAQPTFSYGYSQKIQRAVNLSYVKESGCDYVRRPTGGKTVLHDDEVTYAVVSSEDIFYRDNDLYRSYMLIADVLVRAFRILGLNPELSGGSSARLARSSNPCFSFPTRNEVEINGKKIAGSAQKRDKRALLQHGSIPLSMDYQRYADGTHTTPQVLKQRMTTLGEVSDKTREDLIRALIQGFQDFTRDSLEVFEFDRTHEQAIDRIEKKYDSDDWNHRM